MIDSLVRFVRGDPVTAILAAWVALLVGMLLWAAITRAR